MIIILSYDFIENWVSYGENLIAGSAGIGFTPHVIDVKAGEVLI